MTKIFLNISYELRLEVGPLMFFRAQLFCHAEMFFLAQHVLGYGFYVCAAKENVFSFFFFL